MTFPFGKYLGVEVDQVPDKYLIWLIAGGTSGLDPELAEEIHVALRRSAVRSLAERLASSRLLGAKIRKRVRVFRTRAQRLGVTEEAAQLQQELERITRLMRKRARDERARAQEQVSGGSPVLRAKDGLAGIPPGAAHQGSAKGLQRVS